MDAQNTPVKDVARPDNVGARLGFSGLKSPEQIYRVLGVLCVGVHMILVSDKLFNGIYGLAFLEVVICLLILIDLEASYRSQRFPIPIPVILALLAVDLPFAIYYLGAQEVYWAFPSIVGFMVLGGALAGLTISIATTLVLPVVFMVFGHDIRVLAPLFLSLALTTVIMWYVMRRLDDMQSLLARAEVEDLDSTAFSSGYLDHLAQGGSLKGSSFVLVALCEEAPGSQPASTAATFELKAMSAILSAELGGRDLLFQIEANALLVVMPQAAPNQMFERAQAFRDSLRANQKRVGWAGQIQFGFASMREEESVWEAVSRAKARLDVAKKHGGRAAQA